MPTTAPSGTVTFLFTDIEGSTVAWERDPEVMSRSLARHDRIAREVFEASDGRIFATGGDAFSVAFARAADAIRAGLELQRALPKDAPPEDPIGSRVRVAIHSGEAEERDGDYYGRSLNRTARLLAVGHGGQVLVSWATAVLAGESLPADVALLDLGEHRLRDLDRPERIHQLVHPELGRDFPRLRSLDATLHNLPLQLTSLVGRERELAELAALLEVSRLVTLTGAGGSGKTRLGLHVAATTTESHPDGVWLVELAALSEPELVSRTVAAVLNVGETASRPIEETLADHLQGRRLLLLLDNCEHLIEASARFANDLLQAAAGLRILATSREPLGVAGEVVWPVPSLTLPGVGGREADAIGPDASEAVRLFVDRARLVDPDFAWTEANAEAIARICRRLDGIPLAIELAAARARVLAPDQIASRLDDRFRLLSGGSRTALPRHQTLRAAIDWSWDHLDPEEKVVFRRLAAFAGGWTLEAGEAVCSDGLEGDVLSLLTHLVDKSLVLVDTSGEEARYRMLETVRQYALDHLLESGEAVGIRDRHLRWFAERYGETEGALWGTDSGRWMGRIEADHDNLRGAIDWGLGSEANRMTGLRLVVAIAPFWERRGYLAEGVGWLERALTSGVDDPLFRARALRQLTDLYGSLGEIDRIRQVGAEAVALAREAGDEFELMMALATHSRALLRRGDMGALPGLEEAYELGRRCGPAAAKWLPRIVANVGEIHRMEGRLDEAERSYRESLDLAARVGPGVLIEAMVMFNLGQVMLARGDSDAALALYRDALARARGLAKGSLLGWGVVGVGQVLARRGQLDRAARFFGAREAMHEESGFVLDDADRIPYEAALALVRAGLSPEAFDAAWAEGRRMSAEQAVEEALAVE